MTTSTTVTTQASTSAQVSAEVHHTEEEELDQQYLLNPDDLGEDGEDLDDVTAEGKSLCGCSHQSRHTCQGLCGHCRSQMLY